MGLLSEDNDFRNYVIQKSITVSHAKIHRIETWIQFHKKCFSIHEQNHYYYIDEGPYMLSLEHLVQHYMKFSDGLPTKLRYPVAPEQKPPLPPNSTPDSTLKSKSSCHKLFKSAILRATPTTSGSNDGSSAALISRERKLSKDADVLQKTTQQMKERNLSLPSDDLMNQVGLSGPTVPINSLPSVDSTSPIGTKPKKSPKKTFSPNFLSLKLPKKGKSKSKSTSDKNDNVSNHLVTNDQISRTFSSLSFKSDINADINDSVYKIPNNIPISRFDDTLNHNMLSSTSTLPLPKRTNTNQNESNPDIDYMEKFTQSDKKFGFDETHDKDNAIEEIYFVEAPTKIMSINYVAFKQVPFFPSSNSIADTSNNNAINNNSSIATASTRSERVLSVESTLSNDIDLMLALQNQTYSNGNATSLSTKCSPCYYIPASSIEFDNTLGKGEFGSVSKALMRCETQNGESQKIPVAIKTLLDEHCKENRNEFLREASVMIKLSHHCIVKMIGISKVC